MSITVALGDEDARLLAATVENDSQATVYSARLSARFALGDVYIPAPFVTAERLAAMLDPNVPEYEKKLSEALRLSKQLRESLTGDIPITLALKDEDARLLAETVKNAALKARGEGRETIHLERLGSRLSLGDDCVAVPLVDAAKMAGILDPNVPAREKDLSEALRLSNQLRDSLTQAHESRRKRQLEVANELDKLLAQARRTNG